MSGGSRFFLEVIRGLFRDPPSGCRVKCGERPVSVNDDSASDLKTWNYITDPFIDRPERNPDVVSEFLPTMELFPVEFGPIKCALLFPALRFT